MATTIMIRTQTSENDHFSLRDVCERNHVHAELVMKLVAHGIADPVAGERPGQWLFSADDLARIHRALRLMRDLQVNVAGAALALELLEERNALRRALNQLQQMLR